MVVAVVLGERGPDDVLVCMNEQHLRGREGGQPVQFAAAVGSEIMLSLADGPAVNEAPPLHAEARVQTELRQQSSNTLQDV